MLIETASAALDASGRFECSVYLFSRDGEDMGNSIIWPRQSVAPPHSRKPKNFVFQRDKSAMDSIPEYLPMLRAVGGCAMRYSRVLLD